LTSIIEMDSRRNLKSLLIHSDQSRSNLDDPIFVILPFIYWIRNKDLAEAV